MKDTDSRTPASPPQTLTVVGSSARSHEIARWLDFLARDHAPGSFVIERRRWSELLDAPLRGLVLVDADDLDLADSGLIIRRALRDEVTVWLFGQDAGRSIVTRAAREAGARWLPWPPDLETLGALLGDAPAKEPTVDELEARAAELLSMEDEDSIAQHDPLRSAAILSGKSAELEEIEAILRGDPLPEIDDEELVDDDEDEEWELEDDEVEAFGTPELEPPQLENSAWFKDQIADLADHVQRIELGLARATEEGVSVHASFGQGSAIEECRLKEILDDTMRLGQFTRTLGFVAAPPPRGGQLFDLRTLLEEQLRSRASSENAPRFLTKLPELLPVRSDKTLLLQAFDALFFLAHECTSKDDTLRLEAGTSRSAEDACVEITIRFPRGPLNGMEVEEILRPYGLRGILETLGPNSLAAAAAIFEGQGGQLALSEAESDHLEWQIRLPRVDPGS